MPKLLKTPQEVIQALADGKTVGSPNYYEIRLQGGVVKFFNEINEAWEEVRDAESIGGWFLPNNIRAIYADD